MDTIKDTNALSRQAEEKEKLLKPEKNVYDIIHSKELDLLYKKNTHLLARLSSAGKRIPDFTAGFPPSPKKNLI